MEGTDGTDFADIPTRPMRVKILYTFDAEAKTTCLARLPNTLDIPAVAIDEQSQVGVIELQQCIMAILSASPEIHNVLENDDFSVYTYDYSEFDAPVVGQGRISSLLAVPTPAQDNKTMITGRVCKNIALFNNGIKETLEVKFKLTPLSRPSRGELAKNVDSMRSMSPATSAGFDPNAWNASVHSKTQQVPGDFFNFDMPSMSGDNGAASLEAIFGLETSNSGESHDSRQPPGGVGIQETPSDSAFAYHPAFSNHSHSAPGSRAGSPMVVSNPSSRNGMIRHQSFAGNLPQVPEQNRPASRASVRSESHPAQQPVQQRFQHEQTQQQIDTFYNEDGQPRKRAKVVQTDWRGKSSFGSQSSDLRITAATTSSMQMFRPIAKRPPAPSSDLEPPPRVPTPVPKRTRPIQQRVPSRAPRSSLRQASVADSDFMSDIEPHSDAMTSPEGSSPGNSMNGEGTPMDIPSSPPIVPGYNMPRPSSPGLPTLPPPRLADSGYMSGGFQSGTIMESMEDDGDRSPDADDLALASRYRARKRQQDAFVKSEGSPLDEQDSHIASTLSPDESFSTSRCGSLALPAKMAQGQALKATTKQKRRSLYRSQTANGSEAGSPAPSDTECQSRPRAGRSGSSAPRQVIIQRRLQESIAKGEMPQFCSHCGAIETPVWRKLYVKGFDGAPGTLDSVEGEGETIGIEIQERNHEGHCIKYLIRKSMKKTKDFQPGPGFEQVTVCNPCGLWFNKFRNMRPADRWHRKTMPRNRKKRSNDDDATDGLEPPSEAFFTDQIVPEDSAEEVSADRPLPGASAGNELPRSTAPSHRPRANSMQEQQQNVRRAQRDPEYMRAVQSSPVRQGSQGSPIEVDLTPNPTRRLLFHSPRRDGEDKSLEGGLNVPRPRSAPTADQILSAKQPSGKVPHTPEHMDVSIFEVFTHDKENRAPPVYCDDNLSHLFEGSPGSVFKTPARKTPAKLLTTPRSQKSYGELLKTPTQSNAKRKPLTPSANASNHADMNPNANDFMTSPSSARYFLRSTPSRLERTPGGRTVSGGSRNPSNEVSPFSRHLAQMLSDANGMDGASFTSPSRQFDFSDLPTFTMSGREVDWKGLDEMLSSEFASYDDGSGMAFGADVTGENAHA